MRRYIANIVLVVFMLLMSVFDTYAQSRTRETLERERKENEARIASAEKVLSQTKRKKNATLGRVKALNHQIVSQQKQVSLLEQELSLIDQEVQELEVANNELNKKVDNLKKEYADMLFLASKSSTKLNKLSFLLASDSFNELIMRYKYLEQYTENRKMQVRQIAQVTENLQDRQKELLDKRGEKEKLLSNTQLQNSKLQELKQEQTQVVRALSSEEKKIRKEIANRKKAVKRLNNRINTLIANSTRKTTSLSSAANIALSANFQDNKKRLPWPVSSGFVSDKFGVKNHPVLKGVKVDNHGIDIQTIQNAPVSAVFDGKVLDISQIPGLGNVVAVQHGDYYTIYANLASVNVQINQDITARQTIGIAGQKDGEYEINFQVWYKFDKQNPEYWLSNK